MRSTFPGALISNNRAEQNHFAQLKLQNLALQKNTHSAYRQTTRGNVHLLGNRGSPRYNLTDGNMGATGTTISSAGPCDASTGAVCILINSAVRELSVLFASLSMHQQISIGSRFTHHLRTRFKHNLSMWQVRPPEQAYLDNRLVGVPHLLPKPRCTYERKMKRQLQVPCIQSLIEPMP